MLRFADDVVEVMFDAPTIHARVEALGAAITADYRGKELTVVGIMKGSIFFFTDLARCIDLPITVELMGVSSYHGGTETTGEVRITHDLTKPVHNRHVLLVEDIIDTGLTMSFLLQNFAARHPASVKVVTLLQKPSRAQVEVPIDYTGFVIEDRFVVGYGLDHSEKYRNLPYIGCLKG